MKIDLEENENTPKFTTFYLNVDEKLLPEQTD